MQVDILLLQGVAQNVQYAARHIAHGIDPSALLGDSEQAQIFKETESRFGIKLSKGIVAEPLAAVIVGGGGIAVGEIAAPVAGGQQFAAHPCLTL